MLRRIAPAVSVALAAISTAAAACDPAPTYTREVAPILAESCAGCHREGGVAPMSLETYDDAKLHAKAIADAVSSGRMPPWPAVQDGECPTLDGDRRLDAEQIDLITDWAAAGAPRGSGGPGASAPPTEARWLEGPTTIVEPAEPFMPDPAVDTYRCFLLDPGLETDKFLTAYAVGAAEGVHHMHIWSIDDDVNQAKAEKLDAESPGGGWPCLEEGVGLNARHITVWGPTDPVRRHPAGTGMPLYAGRKLLMQIHHHHAYQPGPFVALELADQVDAPAQIWTLGAAPFVLPPRTPSTKVQARMVMPQAGLLWGTRAHMHDLGARAKVSIERADTSSCLLSIPDFDAKWQLMYFYETPIPILEGDTLVVECTYDTTNKTEDTLMGPTANDEMCGANFYLSFE